MSIHAIPLEAISLYNKALNLSIKGKHKEALSEYKKAIRIYPCFIEAFNNIGEIYSKLGMNDHAISIYKQALGIERNHKVLLNLGVEYYNSRNYRNALDYFIESLTNRPSFLEGHFYSGLSYFNLKDMISAERYLHNVININKRHIKSNYILSYIYYNWREYIKTLTCLDNIKEIADDIVFLNKYYGFCFYHIGKYDKAVEHLTLAVESSPKYEIFRDYLNTLTYENKIKEIGDLDKKIKEMEDKMMMTKPSLREYTHLSVLYIYKGEYKKAEETLVSIQK